jgi:hypothetical protein
MGGRLRPEERARRPDSTPRAGEGSPVTFYERYGFEPTGDLHDDEILLRLELP